MEFKIYCSTIISDNDYAGNIRELLNDIPLNKICGIVFFGLYESEKYHEVLKSVKQAVYGLLGRKVPVTLVPQYSLPNGGLSAEVYIMESENTDLCVDEMNGVCYMMIDCDEYSLLFSEGIPSTDFSEKVLSQSNEIFGRLDSLLSYNGFSTGDIVRQWNYVGNITGYRDGKQNYQEFNDARTAYYSNSKWENGYPAATGIGASFDGVIVGCIAVKYKKQNHKGVYPIDNPLQIAAHEYSKNVLIDNSRDAVKSTPKFERAKLVEIDNGACCFVSGTAAIRGEESMDESSARLQTIQTIENINYLISKENLIRFGCKAYDLKLCNLRVYVKNEKDYDEIKSVVDDAYPNVPVVYTVADVCRGELLVEIEGILIS